MKHYKLREPQVSMTGFTDLFVITHADLTEATDNTDQTIDLDAVAYGDVVKQDVLLEIKTAFDTASADESLTASIGVNGALTQFIGAVSLITAGTAVTTAQAYVPVTHAAYAVPAGGKTLQAKFDITDADGALADHSAGELRLWMNIQRASERDIQA